jgi:cytochrome c oxidase assembly protein subunit 11
MVKLNANDRVLAGCVAVFVAMIGLTYASVPLYRIFCQATGYNGTPKTYSMPSTSASSQRIEVRFDANLGQSLAWEFRPDRVSMNVRLGENADTRFFARNLGGTDMVGTATFNVTPLKAAKYFNKIQCFCFTRQELKSGQSADLGVQFFVDPAIATDPETRDVRALTLSYTFFPVNDGTQSVAEVKTP